MAEIKAVCYDLDDVVVPSYSKVHRPAMSYALQNTFHFVLPDLPEEEHAALIGRPVRQFMTEAFEIMRQNHPERFEGCNLNTGQLYQDYKALQPGYMVSLQDPMPGLYDSLDMFYVNGFRIALVTSGEREYVTSVLKRLDLDKTFDIVITAEDVSEHKPDPMPYEKALEQLDVEPEKALVLEDAMLGIRSAKAAGCKAIGVHNHFNPRQDLSGADAQVESLDQVTIRLINSL